VLRGAPVRHDRDAGPVPGGGHRRLHRLHAAADDRVQRLHPAGLPARLDAGDRVSQPAQLGGSGRPDLLRAAPTGPPSPSAAAACSPGRPRGRGLGAHLPQLCAECLASRRPDRGTAGVPGRGGTPVSRPSDRQAEAWAGRAARARGRSRPRHRDVTPAAASRWNSRISPAVALLVRLDGQAGTGGRPGTLEGVHQPSRDPVVPRCGRLVPDVVPVHDFNRACDLLVKRYSASVTKTGMTGEPPPGLLTGIILPAPALGS
jgi:hypothetical protein